jgi:hypothetical protein
VLITTGRSCHFIDVTSVKRILLSHSPKQRQFVGNTIVVILLFLICVRLEAKTKGHRRRLEIAGAVRRAVGYMLVAVVSISETSVSFYQTTRRNMPEDNHLHSAP